MGRTRYSENERKRMVALFIDITREIMDNEGLEQVSIRKVAKNAGYNSATMYLYFKDVDELITMSSMSYLEDYCRTLAEDQKCCLTATDTYFNTWRLFCSYAFVYPQVFYRLFLYPHSVPLAETISRYYEIYPNQLTGIGGALNEMLHFGTLEQRDYALMGPMMRERGLDTRDGRLISALSVAYFNTLLEEKRELGSAVDDRVQTERLMDAVDFLMSRAEDK